ncbi:MAG: GTPase ObgE [Verrucomicrobia bacterium]|jgi:GTP-binding protein|nr:MAG: GTPase ObgE [Verrucomicrobiota bacterium]
MFIDRVRIHAKAGKGGNGCASFRREKFIPKGGPDGGDGGDGGSVILKASVHETQLASLFYKPILRAENGAPGSSRQKHGKSAVDLILPVPVGTLVYRVPAPPSALALEEEPDETVEESSAPKSEPRSKLAPPDPQDLVADLAEPGEEFVLCLKGHGGRGNIHFKSSRNRAPRRFTEGTEGEESWFLLELRTIAFAGLVGYPNAGKSTLLRALSAAHPKVGSYPFTTRYPQVGVVDLGNYTQTTVADIPGLIEGASHNRGLGHAFLRHIMRCPFLLFVLDMSGAEGRKPWKDLQVLRNEVELYDPELAARPWCVIANKMDCPTAPKNLTEFQKKIPKTTVIPICAELGEGVDTIKKFLHEQLLLLK